MDRRQFIGALAAQPLVASNDRVNVGVIGSGGRGRLLTSYFKETPGVQMTAVCDVYEPNLQKGLEAAGPNSKSYSDYKELLASKDIDAVIVATPDHWHARMIIDAVAAGKDVYCEKPMCHTIAEGWQVIDAVRKSKRVVQIGMQRRSYGLFQEGKKVIDSGVLGPVNLVNAWWYNHQDSTRNLPLEGKLDWKKWLGTAPQREVDAHRFWNWYYYWDYSGGLMIGQAAHVVDAINWYMNSKAPLAVTCAGGKPHLEKVEVPETTTMIIEYPEDYMAVFTVGYHAMRYNSANDQLKQFHGKNARFDVGRESWAVYPESKEIEMKPSKEMKAYGTFERATRSHIANFIDCCHTRRDPNAPVEAGQSTNIVLCMAMEALRSGRRMRYNPTKRDMEV